MTPNSVSPDWTTYVYGPGVGVAVSVGVDGSGVADGVAEASRMGPTVGGLVGEMDAVAVGPSDVGDAVGVLIDSTVGVGCCGVKLHAASTSTSDIPITISWD